MGTYRNYNDSIASGFSAPQIGVFPFPIISKRVPTTADKAPLGTLWVVKSTNTAYVITSIVNNAATWVDVVSSGGSGAFTTITVSGTSTLTGNVTMGGTLGVAGTITSSTGNIVASTGDVTALTLYADGDSGGVASQVALTNVNTTATGTGALTIVSATGSTAHVNAGFLKFYQGTTAVFVPYYTAID